MKDIQITADWLVNNNAWHSVSADFSESGLKSVPHAALVNALRRDGKFDSCVWIITHILTLEQNIKLTQYAAKLAAKRAMLAEREAEKIANWENPMKLTPRAVAEHTSRMTNSTVTRAIGFNYLAEMDITDFGLKLIEEQEQKS